jgi:hypothetical protein
MMTFFLVLLVALLVASWFLASEQAKLEAKYAPTWADILRELADEAWEEGRKDLSATLHDAARAEEARVVQEAERET